MLTEEDYRENLLSQRISYRTISWKGYSLPSWMFFVEEKSDNFIPPTAIFNPEAALRGQAWQSTTKPNSGIAAKILIIDAQINRFYMHEDELTAQFYWLLNMGVEIIFCLNIDNQKVFKYANKENKVLIRDWEQEPFEIFDESVDFAILAREFNIPRSKLVYLTQVKYGDLQEFFSIRTKYLLPINHQEGKNENPVCAAYLQSPYDVYIPDKAYVRGEIVPANSLTIKKYCDEEIHSKEDLVLAINHFPHDAKNILNKHKELIDHELVKELFRLCPESRDITIPFCYEKLGITMLEQQFDYYGYLVAAGKMQTYPQDSEMLEKIIENATQVMLLILSNKSLPKSLYKKCTFTIKELSGKARNHFSAIHNSKEMMPDDVINLIDLSREHSDEFLCVMIDSLSEPIPVCGFLYYLKYAKRARDKFGSLITEQKKIDNFILYVKTYSDDYEFVLRNVAKLQELDTRTLLDLLNYIPRLFNNIVEAIKGKEFKLDYLLVINDYNLAQQVYAYFFKNEYVAKNTDHLKILFIIFSNNKKKLIEIANVNRHLSQKEIKFPGSFRSLTETLIRHANWSRKNLVFTFPALSDIRHFSPQIIKGVRIKVADILSRSPGNGEKRGPTRDLESGLVSIDNNLHARKRYARLLQNFRHSLDEEADFSACTRLSIGVLDQITRINFSKFPNLISLSIYNCTLNIAEAHRVFQELRENCKSLIYVEAPEFLMDLVRDFGFIYLNYKKFTISSPSNKSSPNLLYQSNIPCGLGIIGSGGENPDITFNMQEVGELINKTNVPLHRVRNGVYRLHKKQASLVSLPEKRRKITCHIEELSASLLAELKEKTDYYYYQLKIKCTARKVTKLLSVDAHDELIAYERNPTNTIQFFNDEYGFFYAKCSEDCELTYILKAPPPLSKEDALEKLSDDPIKAIITEFVKREGFEYATPRNPRKRNETIAQWYNRIYRDNYGNCAQRCAAVLYKIDTEYPGFSARVRVVRLSENHDRLEVLVGNECVQIELGGTPVMQTYARSSACPVHRESPTKNNACVVTAPAATNISMPTDVSFQTLLSRWNQDRNIKKLTTLEDLILAENERTICICMQRELLKTQLIKLADKKNVPLFVLNNPNEIRANQYELHIESENIVARIHDILDTFIELHNDNPDAIIVIDWKEFSENDKVAINSIIDEKNQSIYGKRKLKPFKVLSICEDLPEDMSFVTRHREIFSVSEELLPKTFETHQANIDKVELLLSGSDNVLEDLFGKIRLRNNKLVYQSSNLVNLLSEGAPKEYRLLNMPPLKELHVLQLLNQAVARGYFIYCHRKITIPAGTKFLALPLTLHIPNSASKICTFTNCSPSDVPEGAILINSVILDKLFEGKVIENGSYTASEGLIQKHKDKELRLYLTASLSTYQWSYLLHMAGKENVKLQLYVAPKVTLPKNNLFECVEQKGNTQDDHVQSPIIIAQDPERHLGNKKYAFAIEDLSIEDLLIRVSYRLNEGAFSEFHEHKSDILKLLESDEEVTLYGRFSPEILGSLEPLLFEIFTGRSGYKLKLIIEKACIANLTLIDNYCPIIDDSCEATKPKSFYFKEEVPKDTGIVFDYNRSAEFLHGRIMKLEEAYNANQLVLITGHTGVGKTYLFQEIKTTMRETHQVYFGLDSFIDFASDQSEKVKILFLDEINIQNAHLTRFDNLLPGRSGKVLYQGVIYQLDSNHKVVFASNPHSYGGGRYKQKLFASREVAVLEYGEMPGHFIYTHILKPLFAKVKDLISEVGFCSISQQLILKFHNRHATKNPEYGVRDLQEELLSRIFATERPQYGLFFTHPDAKGDFVITPSIKPIYDSVLKAIKIRKLRFLQNDFTVCGLNGCLLQGLPGMGKSQLIEMCLNTLNINRIQVTELRDDLKTSSYIKLDASLPIESIKKYLKRAFNAGVFVWIDELNSISDNGIEACLNAYLSGLDVDTHEKPIRAGFMLLASINGADLQGRAALSPALQARLNKYTMPSPNVDDIKVIIQNKLPNELNIDQIAQMAKDLYALIQTKKATLRDILPRLEVYSGIYRAKNSRVIEEGESSDRKRVHVAIESTATPMHM